MDEKRNVWLHVHVPKAGGSTLRQLMNRNFSPGYYNSTSLLETKQYTSDEVGEIIRCHPWVTCFSDHKLSLDLPYKHDHANLLALCYVRDPVERFISRYFFHRHFEEVACIAQRMNFHDFAIAELANLDVLPPINSQINFLNGGRGDSDVTVITEALKTEQAFLFPIERFDESCILLEERFPDSFPDLSYVRANVSKKDAVVSDEDRALVARHLEKDRPVFETANRELDRLLDETFPDPERRASKLAAFKELCSRRHHNFHPPREPGEAPS